MIWFTGLSGAGKSTLAQAVHAAFTAKGLRSELLDGDLIRSLFPTGFSRTERETHVRHVGFLASRLEHHGVTVACALISPYEASREWVRQICKRFVEIHVSTPLATCEHRDVKGLYARARRGELLGFTGIDAPYEPPVNPALALDTSDMTVDDARDAVLRSWAKALRLDAETFIPRAEPL